VLARTIALASFCFAAAAFGLGAGCGNDEAPSPFGTGGGGAGHGHGGAGGGDAAPDADPTIGGPCVENEQCNDHIDCTFDRCDKTIGRCRFLPDDSQCQDKVYCNGVERCDSLKGCVPGVPVTCSDETPCTIDTCDEENHTCKHALRDADGDGDPDIHCGGGDCDDNDPTVSSKKKEICGNGKDDNCNGKIDEKPCVAPAHDTCLDPLVIKTAGSYSMTTSGAALDYPTSCGFDLQKSPNASDVVAALELPAGAPIDVEITATIQSGTVSVAIAGQCGDPASEIACGAPFLGVNGGGVARFRARAIGSTAAATTFPVYVSSDQPGDITLKVAFLAPVPKATNETCGTAEPITPGVPEAVEIVDAAVDLASTCAPAMGDLVYSFTLAAPADVDVYGTSTDGTGTPMIGLRDAGCALASDEIACSSSTNAHVFRHALDAGTYYVEVSASAPTFVDVDVEVSAPTSPPADETCVGSPVIAPNVTIDVPLAMHQDDVPSSCLVGGIDAAYELDLSEASDVLVEMRTSSGDTGAAAIDTPPCDSHSEIVCAESTASPVRVSKHNLAAGSYRVVLESAQGEPVSATAFVRAAVPPTEVLFADTCAEAMSIPADGGFFQGNTANAHADYPAGCDQAGGPANGAPDEMLKLVLSEKKRVVLDMTGSAYSTLLDVRKGSTCPGAEVPLGCTIGYGSATSFLDLTLEAGTYWIQIDGFDGDSGAWFLDVRVVDP
jgi:hypothetical protein